MDHFSHRNSIYGCSQKSFAFETKKKIQTKRKKNWNFEAEDNPKRQREVFLTVSKSAVTIT